MNSPIPTGRVLNVAVGHEMGGNPAQIDVGREERLRDPLIEHLTHNCD